ncbi:MAG: zf-HC2 domain-containing protein [Armatimonadota bacterium]|nr:zf-HC2 domain-containing protein [bacterium]
MMKCVEIRKMLSAYADGEIKGRTASELQAHVAQCDLCRAEMKTMDVLQSKLREMMSEPVEAVDVSNYVMSQLTSRQATRISMFRWIGVGAAMCFVVLLLVCLFLASSSTERATMRIVQNPPRRHITKVQHDPPPQRKIIVTPIEHHRCVERVAKLHAPRPYYHRHIRRQHVADRRPIQDWKSPETMHLAITSSATADRIEKTISVKLGDINLCQAKVTQVNLQPNEDAASITRPELEVVENRGAAMNQIGG